MGNGFYREGVGVPSFNRDVCHILLLPDFLTIVEISVQADDASWNCGIAFGS